MIDLPPGSSADHSSSVLPYEEYVRKKRGHQEVKGTLLPPKWKRLFYHEKQYLAYYSKKRFVNLACGRGSGKTEVARRKIVNSLALKKPWDDPMYFYALPTINQAKRVAWRPLLNLIPKHWISDINVMEMRIETKFGSVLYVLGLDQPQRAEGVQYDGGVIDESSDVKNKVFDLSIRPALGVKLGWCWRIGVPKRYGIGAAEYKEWYDRGLDNNPNSEIVSYSWPSSDIMSAEEIASVQQTFDIRDYREQYEASWEKAGGLIFHSYSHENLRACSYDETRPIYLGCDFNVNPMAWCMGHTYGEDENKELRIFDEFFIRNTNTQETLDELVNRYSKHGCGFIFCTDAAGKSRHTSASLSDLLQIRNERRVPGVRVAVPKRNPPVLDRFSATNAALCNAAGKRRVTIDPKCKNLINDLKSRAFKEGTRIPDDTNMDSGHCSDGFGYLIWKEFPLRITSSNKARYASA